MLEVNAATVAVAVAVVETLVQTADGLHVVVMRNDYTIAIARVGRSEVFWRTI